MYIRRFKAILNDGGEVMFVTEKEARKFEKRFPSHVKEIVEYRKLTFEERCKENDRIEAWWKRTLNGEIVI